MAVNHGGWGGRWSGKYLMRHYVLPICIVQGLYEGVAVVQTTTKESYKQ